MFKKDSFAYWLENGLKTLENENAFCLNIYDEDDEWTCELVGTNKFFNENDNWYFDETSIYNRNHPFTLITKYKKGNYKEIFEKFASYLTNLITKNPSLKNLVKNKTFAYGFVDDKLYFINTNEKELN